MKRLNNIIVKLLACQIMLSVSGIETRDDTKIFDAFRELAQTIYNDPETNSEQKYREICYILRKLNQDLESNEEKDTRQEFFNAQRDAKERIISYLPLLRDQIKSTLNDKSVDNLTPSDLRRLEDALELALQFGDRDLVFAYDSVIKYIKSNFNIHINALELPEPKPEVDIENTRNLTPLDLRRLEAALKRAIELNDEKLISEYTFAIAYIASMYSL